MFVEKKDGLKQMSRVCFYFDLIFVKEGWIKADVETLFVPTLGQIFNRFQIAIKGEFLGGRNHSTINSYQKLFGKIVFT